MSISSVPDLSIDQGVPSEGTGSLFNGDSRTAIGSNDADVGSDVNLTHSDGRAKATKNRET